MRHFRDEFMKVLHRLVDVHFVRPIALDCFDTFVLKYLGWSKMRPLITVLAVVIRDHVLPHVDW